ncbi:hypothetical protein VTJ49DRAFT_6496 [Mycothermus thermophilus]|uniref:Uncharacterized protein n=1 Tax=Humicola insolens TaxID=85995 RepID=A0ABR3V2B6_HUMIN
MDMGGPPPPMGMGGPPPPMDMGGPPPPMGMGGPPPPMDMGGPPPPMDMGGPPPPPMDMGGPPPPMDMGGPPPPMGMGGPPPPMDMGGPLPPPPPPPPPGGPPMDAGMGMGGGMDPGMGMGGGGMPPMDPGMGAGTGMGSMPMDNGVGMNNMPMDNGMGMGSQGMPMDGPFDGARMGDTMGPMGLGNDDRLPQFPGPQDQYGHANAGFDSFPPGVQPAQGVYYDPDEPRPAPPRPGVPPTNMPYQPLGQMNAQNYAVPATAPATTAANAANHHKRKRQRVPANQKYTWLLPVLAVSTLGYAFDDIEKQYFRAKVRDKRENRAPFMAIFVGGGDKAAGDPNDHTPEHDGHRPGPNVSTHGLHNHHGPHTHGHGSHDPFPPAGHGHNEPGQDGPHRSHGKGGLFALFGKHNDNDFDAQGHHHPPFGPDGRSMGPGIPMEQMGADGNLPPGHQERHEGNGGLFDKMFGHNKHNQAETGPSMEPGTGHHDAGHHEAFGVPPHGGHADSLDPHEHPEKKGKGGLFAHARHDKDDPDHQHINDMDPLDPHEHGGKKGKGGLFAHSHHRNDKPDHGDPSQQHMNEMDAPGGPGHVPMGGPGVPDQADDHHRKGKGGGLFAQASTPPMQQHPDPGHHGPIRNPGDAVSGPPKKKGLFGMLFGWFGGKSKSKNGDANGIPMQNLSGQGPNHPHGWNSMHPGGNNQHGYPNGAPKPAKKSWFSSLFGGKGSGKDKHAAHSSANHLPRHGTGIFARAQTFSQHHEVHSAANIRGNGHTNGTSPKKPGLLARLFGGGKKKGSKSQSHHDIEMGNIPSQHVGGTHHGGHGGSHSASGTGSRGSSHHHTNHGTKHHARGIFAHASLATEWHDHFQTTNKHSKATGKAKDKHGKGKEKGKSKGKGPKHPDKLHFGGIATSNRGLGPMMDDGNGGRHGVGKKGKKEKRGWFDWLRAFWV